MDIRSLDVGPHATAGFICIALLSINAFAQEQAEVACNAERSLTAIRELSVQGSAGATQAVAASQSLVDLALELNGLIRHFRIGMT